MTPWNFTYFEELIRFRKSKIEIIDIDKIELKSIEFKEIKISVSSNRLDNLLKVFIYLLMDSIGVPTYILKYLQQFFLFYLFLNFHLL